MKGLFISGLSLVSLNNVYVACVDLEIITNL